MGRDEVDAGAWDEFVVQHATTPYPQTTLHAQYAHACYGLTPTYYGEQLDDARLQCLVLVDESRRRVKWSGGPVLSGDSGAYGRLTGAFVAWVRSLGCRIRSTTVQELSSLDAMLVCSELLAHTRAAGIDDSLAAMVKKELDGDLWENAVYRSGGRKRKTRAIVDKSLREGVVIASGVEELPFGAEEAYLGHYRRLMDAGFARNEIDGQDSSATAKAFMVQDARGASRTFFALSGKEVVACLNFAISGSEAYLRKLAHAGSSGATYQAMMAAAEWAQSQGLRTLNLTKIRLTADQKTRNLRQYKTRFGGTVHPIAELSERPRRGD